MSEQTKRWEVVYELIRFKPNVKALSIVKTERGAYIIQMRNDKQSSYIQPTAEELAYLSILFNKISQEQAKYNREQKEQS